jgi:hypothetical protein
MKAICIKSGVTKNLSLARIYNVEVRKDFDGKTPLYYFVYTGQNNYQFPFIFHPEEFEERFKLIEQ